jgi:hypothetical protein
MAVLCATVSGLFSLAACAALPKSGLVDGKPCVVVAEKTPFYRYGPAQAFGPDFQLLRGNTALLLRRGFGFSQILTDAGVLGYVPTEDIRTAPEAPRTPAQEVENDVQPELLTGESSEKIDVPEHLEINAGALPKP